MSPLFFVRIKVKKRLNKVLLKSPYNLQHFVYLAYFSNINVFRENWCQKFKTASIFERLKSFYSYFVQIQ